MRKYRNYTDNDIIQIASQVNSMAQLLIKLNLKPAGGNYANMWRLIQKLKIDISHWITDTSWNRGRQLKDWSQYTRANRLKKHLIKLKSSACDNCKNDQWLSKPIPLEIHHLDGNRTNNELSNLQLLCCNCHAQTPNWRNRKSN